MVGRSPRRSHRKGRQQAGPLPSTNCGRSDWSETRVLNGEIGDYVTIARKQRGAENWFLGAVGDEEARTVSFKLDFLTPGKKYVAEIYRDADDADYRTTKRHGIVIEQRPVTSTGEMTLRLAPGGGAAVRFRLVK